MRGGECDASAASPTSRPSTNTRYAFARRPSSVSVALVGNGDSGSWNEAWYHAYSLRSPTSATCGGGETDVVVNGAWRRSSAGSRCVPSRQKRHPEMDASAGVSTDRSVATRGTSEELKRIAIAGPGVCERAAADDAPPRFSKTADAAGRRYSTPRKRARTASGALFSRNAANAPSPDADSYTYATTAGDRGISSCTITVAAVAAESDAESASARAIPARADPRIGPRRRPAPIALHPHPPPDRSVRFSSAASVASASAAASLASTSSADASVVHAPSEISSRAPSFETEIVACGSGSHASALGASPSTSSATSASAACMRARCVNLGSFGKPSGHTLTSVAYAVAMASPSVAPKLFPPANM